MLAKLREKPFDDPNWLYEIKWDGYRAIAELNGRNSRLYSRNGLSFENEYAVIFDELMKIKKKAILDGEIVAFNEKGMPSFQLLQQYGQRNDVPLLYYVFDILSLNGKSLEDKPLIERKQILKDLLPESDVVKYCDHIEGQGKKFFEVMQKKGLEGMIAKRADSLYSEGSRSNDWLKVKHMLTDEAVIAGYTAPGGSRKYFGALILGSYENGELKYIGHTGTGFDFKTLKDVYQKMQPLVTAKNPFAGKVRVNAKVTWVKPKLVCNLKYTEITDEGARRHPVFTGLRTDLEPEEVKAEQPVAQEKSEPVSKDETMSKEKEIAVGDSKLKLTNLDKIFWPEEGYTKGDVINYYNAVYKYIIKHIKDRPQSLRRYPNGIKGQDFFQKDAGGQAPEWMGKWNNWSESVGKNINWLICNDKPSLLYLANLGCIELNPWNSRIQSPDMPDYVVIDLDPSDKNTYDEVIECALVCKDILDSVGCTSYCKTSGATGLHIYIPLGAKYNYDQARQFAEMIAIMTQQQLPDTTTVERSLAKRSKHHIYVDYLQNKQGATLSCVYSLRPKPGASVSTPLDWKELKPGIDPRDYNIENTIKRLEKKGDIFLPVVGKGIDMMKVLKNFEKLQSEPAEASSKIKRIHINSTTARSVGYDEKSKTLEVEFNTGEVYDYLKVPKTAYKKLMDSNSKGAYLNKYIKPEYEYRQVK
jgi:bifunctional non-homologous end joining protein LigD